MRRQSWVAVLVLACAFGLGAMPARADGGPFHPAGPMPPMPAGVFFVFPPEVQFFVDVSSNFPFIFVQGVGFDGFNVFPFTAIGQVVHITVPPTILPLDLTISGQVQLFFGPGVEVDLAGVFDSVSGNAVTDFADAVQQSVQDAVFLAFWPFPWPPY